jgi:thiamine-monophosphate kinase
MDAFGFPLLGGDTVKTPGPLTISVTAFGTVPQGCMVPRTGAQAGDILYVTGTIGDAALGLLERQGKIVAGQGAGHLLARYLVPEPRNVLADVLRDHAHAAMDLSDGLIGDLTKMMRVSGVTADVRVKDIPLSPAAAATIGADEALLAQALSGGDDYELLASIPSDRAPSFEAGAAALGVAVTPIGRVMAGGGEPSFLLSEGRQLVLASRSYSHF